MRLEGKTVLITGAGSGLGGAMAEAMARVGADVAVNDIDADAARRTTGLVRNHGRRAESYVADVSDSAAVAAMVERVVSDFGTVDVLVNNAGILQIPDGVVERSEKVVQEMLSSGGIETQLLATQSLRDEDWTRMLAVHVNGTFFCTREVLRVMEAKRAGKIINIASIAGTTGLSGVPHYSAAKGAIIAFTKSVAKEVVRFGINVNAIAPGFVDTPLLQPLSQVMMFATVAQIPMGRLGRTDEIAGAAVFLASDEASYMVGQVVSPNGGQVI